MKRKYEANSREKITLVGAGLVGSLLAIFLARRGFRVELLERRPDMRAHPISAGRSINLAISTRGINALKKLGLDREILSHAIAMKGRMVHSLEGDVNLQPYGTEESHFINSISRATLNKVLMSHAEEHGVQISFEQRVTDFNVDAKELVVLDEQTKQTHRHASSIVIGTDGSASAVRDAMVNHGRFECSSSDLSYGYKELVIPPGPNGEFLMERNALHIWPRGTYMLIALPNFEGSYTCTLFLPWMGPVSFEQLQSRENVSRFFNEHFRDAVPLIDDLEETFFHNPTGHMTTIKCNPWHCGGSALLMGDAAHGIVPFFGQGMNCGFEDCTVFDEAFDQFESDDGAVDWSGLFAHMSSVRVPNTNAIADMAVENFIEMRDKVADPKWVMEKAAEKVLQKHFAGKYISRYALVTFSNIPYSVAMEAGIVEDALLSDLCAHITKPEDIDLARAKDIIDQKLWPILSRYSGDLAVAAAH